MPIFIPDKLKTPGDFPSLDANDNQVRGFGFFDDNADRSALDENFRCHGYLAFMKDTNQFKQYNYSIDVEDANWGNDSRWVLLEGQQQDTYWAQSGDAIYYSNPVWIGASSYGGDEELFVSGEAYVSTSVQSPIFLSATSQQFRYNNSQVDHQSWSVRNMDPNIGIVFSIADNPQGKKFLYGSSFHAFGHEYRSDGTAVNFNHAAPSGSTPGFEFTGQVGLDVTDGKFSMDLTDTASVFSFESDARKIQFSPEDYKISTAVDADVNVLNGVEILLPDPATGDMHFKNVAQKNFLFSTNTGSGSPTEILEMKQNEVISNVDLNVLADLTVGTNENSPSLEVNATRLMYRYGNDADETQAVIIDQGGVITGGGTADTVALSIGSRFEFRRNGGGSSSMKVSNGLVMSNFGLDWTTVTNTNPSNNGQGLHLGGDTSNGVSLVSMNRNAYFGALNTAGSTLYIGNVYSAPGGGKSGGASDNWAQTQGVNFMNTSAFRINYGGTEDNGSGDFTVFSHSASNTDLPDGETHGLQFSAVPNAGANTSGGASRFSATNGSGDLTANTAVRNYVEVGSVVYIQDEGNGGNLFTLPSTITRHVVTAKTTQTITVDPVFSGTTGTVSVFMQKNVATFRDFDGNPLLRIQGNKDIAAYGHMYLVDDNSNTLIGSSWSNLTTGARNVSLGEGALGAVTTGVENTAIGRQSLRDNQAGNRNVAIGYQALLETNNSFNVAIGYQSLFNDTESTGNTAIGFESSRNSTGDYMVAVGHSALKDSTGGFNVGVGYEAGKDAVSNSVAVGYRAESTSNDVVIGHEAGNKDGGDQNVVVGRRAGQSANATNVMIGHSAGRYTTGSDNTVVGFEAFVGVSGETTRSNITAIGRQALLALKTGSANTAVGDRALKDLQDGANNVAVGNNAGEAVVNNNNVFVGVRSGQNATESTGGDNVFVGYQSGINATGDQSTIIGSSAGEVSAGDSVIIGYQAGRHTTGSSNTVVGHEAFLGASGATTASNITAIGRRALNSLTTGVGNTAVGNNSLESLTVNSLNVAIGSNAGANIVNTANTVIGVSAGENADTSSGGYNVLVGLYAGRNITGSQNVCLGAQSAVNAVGNNVIIGLRSGTNVGSQNIVIGMDAGQGGAVAGEVDNSVAIGYEAGRYTTGSGNTIVGYQAYKGVNGSSTRPNTTAIGYQALLSLTTGASNTAVGHRALASASTKGSNVAVGTSAMENADETGSNGQYITAVGVEAGQNIVGQQATLIGFRAGKSATGAVTAFGYRAGQSAPGGVFIGQNSGSGSTRGAIVIGPDSYRNVTSSGSDIAIGNQVMWSNSADKSTVSNVVVGNGASYNAGGDEYNMVMGTQSLRGTVAGLTRNRNVAIGYQSMYRAYTGANNNVAVGYRTAYTQQPATDGVDSTTYTFERNVFIGDESGYDISSGSQNVCVGYRSAHNLTTGDSNTLIGYLAGDALTTGSDNVLIGFGVGGQLTTESDRLYIANSDTTTPLIYGDFNVGVVGIGYGEDDRDLLDPTDPDERFAFGVSPDMIVGKRGFSTPDPVAGKLWVVSSNSTEGEMGFCSQYHILAAGFRSYPEDSDNYARDLRMYTKSDSANSSEGDERLRITGAGDVGIGETSPDSKLHVNGGDIEISDSSNGLILTDTATSTRYRVQITNGAIAINSV